MNCSNVGNASILCSPSDTTCSSLGPPQTQKSYQETCSSVSSSLHGSPTGSLSGIHLLQNGSPPQASGGSVHPHGSPCASRAPLPHHGLQGNFSFSARNSSCPSFTGHSCSSHIFSLCSSLATITSMQQLFFFSFLNMLTQRHYYNS